MNPIKESYQPNNIFLTDGQQTVFYNDLVTIFERFNSKFRSLENQPEVIGIDTSDRFQAVMWMTVCWMKTIPFVPFNKKYSGPIGTFEPDVIVSPFPEFATRHFAYNIFPGNNSTNELKNSSAGSHVFPFLHWKERAIIELTANPQKPFCGLLTSGSSGSPKSVPLLRRQMIAAANNAFRSHTHLFPSGNESAGLSETGHFVNSNRSADYLWGNPLPLYHAGGVAIIFRALLNGCGIFLWNRFDSVDLCRDLEKYTALKRLSLVPTMLKRVVEYAKKQKSRPRHHLEEILIGGGPAPSELVDKARRDHWPVVHSYGMTETCGQISVQSIKGESPPNSVGQPFPDHEISIKDSNNLELPPEETGELWVRGPQVFPGYLSPSDSLKSFLPGNLYTDSCFCSVNDQTLPWFKTGDYAWKDRNGNLFIENRRTDIIITGGENVSVINVESALLEIQNISDAGVTGLPDDEWGQILVALVTSSTELEQSQIRKHLNQKLLPPQIPKKIFQVSYIPRTSLGKIRRKELQKWAATLMGD